MRRAKPTRSANGSAGWPARSRRAGRAPTTRPRRADDRRGPTIAMAPNTDEKGAAELGREALAQFRDAARYGAKALAARKAARGGASKGADRLKGQAAGLKDRAADLKDRAPSIRDRPPGKEQKGTSSSVKD